MKSKFVGVLVVTFTLCQFSVANIENENNGPWRVLAHPKIVVPGEESVIFILKNDAKIVVDKNLTSNDAGPSGTLPETDADDLFSPIESSELVATLTLMDGNKREIFGKLWRVDSNQGLIRRSRAQILNSVYAVPFRVPAHFGDGSGFVEGANGLVQVRDDALCPAIRGQSDWKCPDTCKTSGKCLEVEFSLTSRLRQIVIFTEKTKYHRKEQVEIFYQPIDEMTMAKKWPLLTLWIEDSTESVLYEWRLGQTTEETEEEWQFFRKLSYPLGLKASAGKWRTCATTHPWIQKAKSKSRATNNQDDGSITNCSEFEVVDDPESEQPTVITPPWDESQTSVPIAEEDLTFEQHFVTLKFASEMKKKFERNIPISGRIISSSSEKEIEISVQLIDIKGKEERVVVEEQILMLTDEAVFEFAPIDSKTTSKNLLIEARLISVSEQLESSSEEPESLEITEDENGTKQFPDMLDTSAAVIETFGDDSSLNVKTFKTQHSNYLLASVVITEQDPTTQCPLWTKGLQRSFKSGDRATITVLSPCSCQSLGPLHWIVKGRNQFISWGSQDENSKVESDPQENDGRKCQYHFTLDITSRMFPTATLLAWSPHSKLTLEQGVHHDSKIILDERMAYGQQDMTVSFHDRAMAILELNVTEVNHSQDHVGAEVFVEPYSFICLLGTKLSDQQTTQNKNETGHQKNSDDMEVISREESSSSKFDSGPTHDNDDRGKIDSADTVSLQALRPFNVGPSNWFFKCGNASEDGFYSTTVKAPPSSGTWTMEAISVSPLHGLRVSKTRSVKRNQPLEVDVEGLPKNVKRNETIKNMSIVIRNNMPLFMQLTIIVTSSTDKMIFSSSGLHYDTVMINVTAYQTIATNFTISVGPKIGTYNITGHVSGVALVENRLLEMDSFRIVRTLTVESRGQRVEETINDYFCANEDFGLAKDEQIPDWSFHNLAENSEGVTFGSKSHSELILSLDGAAANNAIKSGINFQLVIGSEENSVTWISLVKNGREQRLQTILTPDILSASEFRYFWVTWKPEEGLIKFGLGSAINNNPILTWPLQPSFKPTRIGIKNIFPGYIPNIRFWSLHNEDGEGEERKDGGHNRIFNLNIPWHSINQTVSATFSLSSEFMLPMYGTLFSESFNKRRPETLDSVLEVLRDAATLALAENQGNDRYTMLDNIPHKMLIDRLHQTMQDLLYFKNVDGSFGEPLVKETFSLAMEHFYLLKEIESFYHVSPQLISSLQRWILQKCGEAFNADSEEELQSISLDILEWAPIESMIFDRYAPKAYKVVEQSLKTRLSDGVGIFRLSRHLATLIRASGLAAGDYLSPTPASPSFVSNVNITDRQRDEDVFLSGLLTELSSRLEDVLNCELEIRETDSGTQSNDHDLRDLVNSLSAFAHSFDQRPEGGGEDPSLQIFECLHSHSNQLLRRKNIGYSVVRALAEYRLGRRHHLNQPDDRDLKVSVGSGDSAGPATTWHVVTSQKSNKEFLEEIHLDWPHLPNKIYFLATGYGCSNVQLRKSYETFHTGKTELYDVAIDISENLDEDDHLFFTVCLRLKNSSREDFQVPTTVLIEMFSGFEFQSLTGLNVLGTKQIGSTNGVLKYFPRDQFLLIHMKELSSDCGSCFTIKYRRKEIMTNLSPGKLIIYPTLEASYDSTIVYFHSAHNDSQLRAGIQGSDWSSWMSNTTMYSNGGVISSQPIPHICPCSLQCDSSSTPTTPTKPSTTTTSISSSTPATTETIASGSSVTSQSVEPNTATSTTSSSTVTSITSLDTSKISLIASTLIDVKPTSFEATSTLEPEKLQMITENVINSTLKATTEAQTQFSTTKLNSQEITSTSQEPQKPIGQQPDSNSAQTFVTSSSDSADSNLPPNLETQTVLPNPVTSSPSDLLDFTPALQRSQIKIDSDLPPKLESSSTPGFPPSSSTVESIVMSKEALNQEQTTKATSSEASVNTEQLLDSSKVTTDNLALT